MPKHDHILARQQMRQFLKDTGVSHHMFYGPTSDKYWSAPLRVLAINMEPYGYEDCGFVEVDWPCLRDWMYDAGSTHTKTVRYTLAIMRTLIDTYASGTVPTGDYLRMAYSDAPALEAIAQRVGLLQYPPHIKRQQRARFREHSCQRKQHDCRFHTPRDGSVRATRYSRVRTCWAGRVQRDVAVIPRVTFSRRPSSF